MASRRLVYLVCDSCGDPCAGELFDDVREARYFARRNGWKRVGGRGDARDVCWRCLVEQR